MKKSILVILCLVLCLSICACNNVDTPETTTGITPEVSYEIISLTPEEEGIIEAIGSDVNVVTDETYVKTIGELIYHSHEYSGTVYQLEGVFSVDGENLSIYRTLVNGDTKETLGLPLQYVEKEIEDGAWIRVTAIVSEIEVDGSYTTALDVVAIESLAAYGQAEIQWDGSEIHQH